MSPRSCWPFLIFPLLISCSGKRLDVDVSGVKIPPVKIDRIEKDLFAVTSPDIRELDSRLKNKYGSFYRSFLSIIKTSGGKQDSSDLYNLGLYVSDTVMKEIYSEVQKTYPDLKDLETGVTDVFKHYRYYFPNRQLPRVVSDMSAFYFYVLSVDTTVGIDLEFYLGSGYKVYQMAGFPRYKTVNMRKEYILPDFVRAWMTTEFPKEDDRKDFLSEIIYKGKLLYLCDALLPNLPDTLKMGYTAKQSDWCRNNEYNMWAYFVQKKVLYLTDPSEIVKYNGEGPFTSAFNKESPSRVGLWVGWQIVRSYMNHHPEISLEQLMNQQDAQVILSKSKYKPSR